MREIWTLTVDGDTLTRTVATVHNTEAEAIKCLFDNYDQADLYDGDMQALIDGECLVVYIDSHNLPGDPTPGARADGTVRMTDAQRDRLWQLCAGYNVPFRETDYIPAGKQNGVGNGWYEGWVGGVNGSGVTARKTIYVGVNPEGESYS